MLIYCPNCNREIEDNTNFCGHCGYALVGDNPTNHKKNSLLLISILASFVVIGLSVFIYQVTQPSTQTTVDSSSSRVKTAEEIERDASRTAQRYVKSRLKCPSTAEFPDASVASISCEDSVYTVFSYVDAQNSFGAMIRTYYEVTLTYDSEKDDWIDVNVEIKK